MFGILFPCILFMLPRVGWGCSVYVDSARSRRIACSRVFGKFMRMIYEEVLVWGILSRTGAMSWSFVNGKGVMRVEDS